MSARIFSVSWIFIFLLEVLASKGLNMEKIAFRFLAVSDKIWQPVVREAIDICFGRISIDATLEERSLNGCRLQPALFASCIRRNLLANCPVSKRPKTDSNSCTQRLTIVRNKCDPFAWTSKTDFSSPEVITTRLARPKPTTARPLSTVLTKAVPNPTPKIPLAVEAAGNKPIESPEAPSYVPAPEESKPPKSTDAPAPPAVQAPDDTKPTIPPAAPTTLPAVSIVPSPQPASLDETADIIPESPANDDVFTTENREVDDEDEPGKRRGITEIGDSLVTIQRQIRNIDSMEKQEERAEMAGKLQLELDSVSGDMQELGQSRPELLQMAPRLANIGEQLGAFGQLRVADGLGARLVLEVDAVRRELQAVADNIRVGIQGAGDVIRSNVSSVVLNVAGEAIGISKTVGDGLKSAGDAIKNGVSSAQNGVSALTLEGIAQLQSVGTDVAAGVDNVKTNFQKLTQDSFQRIKDSSDSVNAQLVSGLQRLIKLREESQMGAQALALNIQNNIRERLDDMTKQFSSLNLQGK